MRTDHETAAGMPTDVDFGRTFCPAPLSAVIQQEVVQPQKVELDVGYAVVKQRMFP